jgi:hypothetical protein
VSATRSGTTRRRLERHGIPSDGLRTGGAAIEQHARAEETEAILRLRRRILGERRRATTVALASHARAVAPAVARGTRPGRRYWNDCYRQAADYVLTHRPGSGRYPGVAGMSLVHGVCRSGPLLWAHAWVELPDDTVFCGVRQRFYDRAGFQRVLGATAEATYRPDEMVAWLMATERYGPWHRGILGDRSARRLDSRDFVVAAATVLEGQWGNGPEGRWASGMGRAPRHQGQA